VDLLQSSAEIRQVNHPIISEITTPVGTEGSEISTILSDGSETIVCDVSTIIEFDLL
jgi:hypothetical protein